MLALVKSMKQELFLVALCVLKWGTTFGYYKLKEEESELNE
jgi:hypothetical protein